MPPFIPRKRRRSPTPPAEQGVKRQAPASGRKPTLFASLDALPTNHHAVRDNLSFLERLDADSSDSSLSDISSAEFEDVEPAIPSDASKTEGSEDEDSEVDWEEVHRPPETSARPGPEPSGDLELTLNQDDPPPRSTGLGGKRGPSKRERQMRVDAHRMHVQSLLFHNKIRNAWIGDQELQKILVGHLTKPMVREVERWKTASGLSSATSSNLSKEDQGGKREAHGSGRADKRVGRDWSRRALVSEQGKPDLSRGDPVFRLLKVLSSFWRKRFRIVAPGLRKIGYKPLETLAIETASYRTSPHDPKLHGERVRDLEEFRELGRNMQGSRDIGAQLFTALLRGLGLDARLVASLQPLGFGWGQVEVALMKRRKEKPVDAGICIGSEISTPGKTAVCGDYIEKDMLIEQHKIERLSVPEQTSYPKAKPARGTKTKPIDLSEDSAVGTESNRSGNELSVPGTSLASARDHIKSPSSNTFDRDLPQPIYWTEVLSPIRQQYIPVDALVMNCIATNPDLLASFEPRSAKAEKAKQVIAYVVAYSSDGTAKDVTVRYLKRHMWPGRTKGVRMPVEKIPIYNHRGKVITHEEFDWFKNVMSYYARDASQRTAIDALEDEQDLQGVRVVREVKAGEETLQWYKNSAEFVLERHLRREEALVLGATHVRTFSAGKGDKIAQEKVFRREDVVTCKTSESWHKEGREVLQGEQPRKLVPIRAVTLARKREIEDAEREGGERLKQGLYSRDQTGWIIPPPIKDGIIPRNAFGNIDCYVPSMVPQGAVHLALRGTAKICRRAEISFAEAVTGFEFKSQRAVPVVEGVVVAQEHERMVMDAWLIDEEERKKREEGKREKMALALWRKMLMGMRILARVRDEYGEDANSQVRDEMNPFTNRKNLSKRPQRLDPNLARDSEDGDAGEIDLAGIHSPPLREGYGEGDIFLRGHDPEISGGGFLVEDVDSAQIPPTSLLAHSSMRPTSSGDQSESSDSDSGSEPPPRRGTNTTTGSGPTTAHTLSSSSSKIKIASAERKQKKPVTVEDSSSSDLSDLESGGISPTMSSAEERNRPRARLDLNPIRDVSSAMSLEDKTGVKKASKPRRKSPPKRQAKPRTKTALRSHYFSHGDEDDEVVDNGSAIVNCTLEDADHVPAAALRRARKKSKGVDEHATR